MSSTSVLNLLLFHFFQQKKYFIQQKKNMYFIFPFTGKDVIPEESELEEFDDGEKSYVTDSCIDEEQEHIGSFDENSLAFERDLDKHPEEGKKLVPFKIFAVKIYPTFFYKE